MITNARKVRPPCGKSCAQRAVGCHAACDKWAEYVTQREADYAHRVDVSRVGEAIRDGYRRLGSKR